MRPTDNVFGFAHTGRDGRISYGDDGATPYAALKAEVLKVL